MGAKEIMKRVTKQIKIGCNSASTTADRWQNNDDNSVKKKRSHKELAGKGLNSCQPPPPKKIILLIIVLRFAHAFRDLHPDCAWWVGPFLRDYAFRKIQKKWMHFDKHSVYTKQIRHKKNKSGPKDERSIEEERNLVLGVMEIREKRVLRAGERLSGIKKVNNPGVWINRVSMKMSRKCNPENDRRRKQKRRTPLQNWKSR